MAAGQPDLDGGNPDLGNGEADLGLGEPDLGLGEPDLEGGNPDLGNGGTRSWRRRFSRPRPGYADPVDTKDTSGAAQEAQLAAWRRLGPSGRMQLAAEMSEDVRAIALEGISRLHPELSRDEARHALLVAMYGEALAARVARARR